MAKNNAMKKQKQIIEDDFDFPEIISSSYEDHVDDSTIAEIMGSMIEVSNNQMLMALDLTRLALEKKPKEMNEDDVFAVFNKAADVVYQKFPLQKLLKDLEIEG